MEIVEVLIAILAGLAALCIPPVPRWWFGETGFFPPVPTGDEPRPTSPLPDPWLPIAGLVAGLGGAFAWILLGDGFAREGALAPPVVLGILGGIGAGWLVGSIRSLTKLRAR